MSKIMKPHFESDTSHELEIGGREGLWDHCAFLFGWFTGTTAQSDFSSAPAVRFTVFADRS